MVAVLCAMQMNGHGMTAGGEFAISGAGRCSVQAGSGMCVWD